MAHGVGALAHRRLRSEEGLHVLGAQLEHDAEAARLRRGGRMHMEGRCELDWGSLEPSEAVSWSNGGRL